MRLAIAYDDIFLEHVSQGPHPERPDRLIAIRNALRGAGLWDSAEKVSPREATIEELTRVHATSYVHQTLERLERGYGHLDPDTFFSPGSREAALKAAGAGVDVARLVWTGDADVGLALVRPPGHHAEANRAGGFCIFNNIAVAAEALLAEGANRILVFDWDVHHGNGTQHEFSDRRDLLYISSHAWPHYPGTGLSHEIGSGDGTGFTANVPFPHGAGDADYAQLMDRLVAPLARAYRPDAIFISAGFDAHENDLLGGMGLTVDGFGYMASVLRGVADELCGGKVVLFLEGGYDLTGLSTSLVRSIQVLGGREALKPASPQSPRHTKVLEETIRNLRPHWQGLE